MSLIEGAYALGTELESGCKCETAVHYLEVSLKSHDAAHRVCAEVSFDMCYTRLTKKVTAKVCKVCIFAGGVV